MGTITLRELSTHTSGLPRLPSNLHGTPQNVFTGYTDDDLFGFLGNLSALPTRGQFLCVFCPLPFGKPGPRTHKCSTLTLMSRSRYSNLAFGLLGRLLELKTGISYEALVRKILLNPLGMNDTKIALTPTEWQTDVAPGRNASGQFAERNTPYAYAALNSHRRPLLPLNTIGPCKGMVSSRGRVHFTRQFETWPSLCQPVSLSPPTTLWPGIDFRQNCGQPWQRA